MPTAVRDEVRRADANGSRRTGRARRAGGRRLRARSRSGTWPTRSSTSRCSAATTSPRYTLCCFGGAAGQHACLVADALGMTRVFIHPLAGVLSAYGMGLADQAAMREQAVEAQLEQAAAPLEDAPEQLASEARDELVAPGRAAGRRSRRPARASEVRRHRHGADRRARPRSRRCVQQFEAAYRKQFCFLMPGRALDRRGGVGRSDRPPARRSERSHAARRSTASPPADTVRMFTGGAWHATPVYRRERPRARASASTARRSSPRPTRPPWSSRTGAPRSRRSITWCSKRVGARTARTRDRHHGRSGDAGDLQQPVHVDRRADGRCGCRTPPTRSTSRSASISPARCSTPQGNLIANAPHMPVHLGSMGESIKTVIRAERRAG